MVCARRRRPSRDPRWEIRMTPCISDVLVIADAARNTLPGTLTSLSLDLRAASTLSPNRSPRRVRSRDRWVCAVDPESIVLVFECRPKPEPSYETNTSYAHASFREVGEEATPRVPIARTSLIVSTVRSHHVTVISASRLPRPSPVHAPSPTSRSMRRPRSPSVALERARSKARCLGTDSFDVPSHIRPAVPVPSPAQERRDAPPVERTRPSLHRSTRSVPPGPRTER